VYIVGFVRGIMNYDRGD